MELLVAISIIAILSAIGVGVGIKMTTEARRVQTREMMQGLIAANVQYKAVRQGVAISHSGPTAGLSSTEQFVAACLTVKTCEDIMLSALNSSSSSELDRVYKDGGGNSGKAIYDRWGTELEYRQFNSGGTGNGPNNEAGTAVPNNKLPISRDPFFASAGPDQEWGTDDDIDTTQQ